jgi:hypothetical protein
MINKKGFSLVEALVYTFILAIVLAGLYSMIIYYRNLETTEQARVRMQQESRFILSDLMIALKDAGSVLTLENTGSFLKRTPYFNGIFPLNNTNFADGLIIAKGDPDAVTKLTTNFNPSSSTIQVENTLRKDNPSLSAWSIGDKGIVINENGYYVFYVTGVSANQISIRNTAVYYSGLLNTTNYIDHLISPATSTGKNIIYSSDTPVIKLYDFTIYLVQEKNDPEKKRKIRELIKITDAKDQADVLNSSVPVKGVAAENIWDIQFIYTIITDLNNPSSTQTNYCASSSNSWINPISNPCVDINSTNCKNFTSDIRNKKLKEITLRVVMLTDNYSGKGTVINKIPPIGDEATYTLPTGKYSYKLYTLKVAPRNFNIIM